MNIVLNEIKIKNSHEWAKKRIKDIKIPNNTLVVMIRRDDKIIVPNGDTLISEDDTLVLTKVI